MQIISEAPDRLQAVQKAQKLQPDLILLNIGLPALNAIDAARRIRRHPPASKSLFVSENRSAETVGKGLGAQAAMSSYKWLTGICALVANLQGSRFRRQLE